MCVGGARERERRKQEVAGAGLAVDAPLKNRSKKNSQETKLHLKVWMRCGDW